MRDKRRHGVERSAHLPSCCCCWVESVDVQLARQPSRARVRCCLSRRTHLLGARHHRSALTGSHSHICSLLTASMRVHDPDTLAANTRASWDDRWTASPRRRLRHRRPPHCWDRRTRCPFSRLQHHRLPTSSRGTSLRQRSSVAAAIRLHPPLRIISAAVSRSRQPQRRLRGETTSSRASS